MSADLRRLPSGRQAHRLRRPRAGAAAARLRSGPRGRSGQARYAGGSRRQAPLGGRCVARDPRAGWTVRPSLPWTAGRPRDSGSQARRQSAAFHGRRPVPVSFVATAREFPARVFRLDVATGRREVWKELMPGDPAGMHLCFHPRPSPKTGRRFSSSIARVLSDSIWRKD